MDTNSQLSAIIAWAQNRGIDFTVHLLNRPPAMLDGIMILTPQEQAQQGAGLCLTVAMPEWSKNTGSIGFWITPDGCNGTWSTMIEGDDRDDVIALDWIPNFADENELISFVDRTTDASFLQNIFATVLDEWLADNALPYHVVEKKEFSGEAAEEAFNGDLMNWLFVEFQDAGGYDITLGISGKGEAATFYSDEEGFLTFDQRGTGFKTGDDLTAWLESSITCKS